MGDLGTGAGVIRSLLRVVHTIQQRVLFSSEPVVAFAADLAEVRAIAEESARCHSALVALVTDEAIEHCLAASAAHGSLSAAMQSPLSDRVLVRIAMQVCEAMLDLVDAGEVHGDLCARSVLVFSLDPPVAKIAGFRVGAVSAKSDIWAFGVLLWQMWSRGDVPAGVDSGIIAAPAGCPGEVYALMCRCWHPDTGEGPTFAELYEALLGLYLSVSEQLCVICLDNRPSVACVPCGHLCLCATDAAAFVAGTMGRCP